MSEPNHLGPSSPKQQAFINADGIDIVLFGGAAGSGKSYLGVMAMLKWIEHKKFRGVMVRRTMVQVTGPGGLAETALDMYQPFGGRFKSKECKFVFPSGASIVCKGCEQEKDKHNFQGWQVSVFLIDEAQQFEESQVIYFISRLRTEADMKTQMLMTANPDYNSFLRKWLEGAGYLDEKGLPRKDRDGKVMWFIRVGNNMVWRETKEELHADYGEDCGPMSFMFLPATCDDNPVLLERDKTYKFKLMNLPRVEMERLYLGSWYARETASTLFQREWIEEITEIPEKEVIRRIRIWDLSGTLVSEKNRNPDYTASTLMAKLKDGSIVIESAVRFRARYGEVIKKMIEIGLMDGNKVDIITPRDPGQAGIVASQLLVRELTAEGLYVKSRPTTKSKMERFRPFAAAAEHRLIKMVSNCTDDLENKIFANNEPFFDELESFDGSRSGHDDWCDTVSEGYNELARSKTIPNFLSGMKSINLSINNPLNSF